MKKNTKITLNNGKILSIHKRDMDKDSIIMGMHP